MDLENPQQPLEITPPENLPPATTDSTTAEPITTDGLSTSLLTAPHRSFAERVFLGADGLRSGWSVLIWFVLVVLLLYGFGTLFAELGLLDRKSHSTPRFMFFNQLSSVLALAGSMVLMALIERRSFRDYYLQGPRMIRRFFAGLAVGFAGLSALIGALSAGGWLHFGGIALSGIQIFGYAILWGAMFLLVGLFEEGAFRCYLQATFTRGINFWWALGIVGVTCAILALINRGNGVRGDYVLAALGLIPCFLLHVRRAPSSGFWQAAWATSTLFGSVHTGNAGESWVGIFAAGAIGFVFCVSVRLTGSAWWAIGAHAGWDWGETYFYGTPDSGMVAPGHYLNTSLAGNPLWSGGSTGPEGSLLVLAAILLMLIWLLAVYGRKVRQAVPAASLESSVAPPGN